MNNQWLNKMKEWWLQLAPREKKVVSIGGIVVIIFIFYGLLWTPYVNHVASLRTKVLAERKLLVWMQAADLEIQRTAGNTQKTMKITTPVQLLSWVQEKMRVLGLMQYMTGLKQASADSIEMHFQKVEFDKLMLFLISTLKAQKVSVAQFSASADNSPGIVNADVVIKLNARG